MDLGRSWTYHMQAVPALWAWELSPCTVMVASAGASASWRLAARPSFFVLICFAPPTLIPSELLPPLLGWAGSRREKGENGPSPARFPAVSPPWLPAAQSWAAAGRWLQPQLGSPCFPRRDSLTPLLSRLPLWRSVGTELSPSEKASWVLESWVTRALQSVGRDALLLTWPSVYSPSATFHRVASLLISWVVCLD